MLVQGFLLSYKYFETTTKPCLDSLLPQALECGVPIMVGDNCSPDHSPLLLSEYADQLSHLHFEQAKNLSVRYFDQNFGYAGGMNRLTQSLDAEWLLLIGSDTVFAPGSLKRLQIELQRAPDSVGILGPVTNSAGTAQCLSFMGNTAKDIIQEWETLHSATMDWLPSLPRADFFCVAIRRSLWQSLKGLDEAYGRGYYEDVDFCVRANRSGFSCCIAEDCFVFHQGSATFGKERDTDELIRRNKSLLLSKYPNEDLLHVREDTYNLIKKGISELGSGTHYGSRLNRIKNRMQVLDLQKPKSFHKKMIWSLRRDFLDKEINALY